MTIYLAGYETAKQLKQQGLNVIQSARDPKKGQTAAKEYKFSFGSALDCSSTTPESSQTKKKTSSKSAQKSLTKLYLTTRQDLF